MKLIVTCVTVSLIVFAPARAQQTDDYPTVAALQQAVIPTANLVELAERLRGAPPPPPPPASAPPHQVGEQQAFWALDTSGDREFQVTATLRVVGQHIYLWVENGAPVSDSDLQALAGAFDTRVYDRVRLLWGSEASPGIDGDPRLYGLFAHGLGSGTAAYFVSRHTYPRTVFPTSNEHEMFFFNLDALGTGNIARPAVESIVAHEFQHMIRANVYNEQDTWLNEGLSTFTQLYLYHDADTPILNFLGAPDTQLNAWPEDENRTPHYGAAALFIDYFFERYGLDALREMSQTKRRGLDAFDRALRARGEAGVDDFFADWTVANFALNPSQGDGRYGYNVLPPGTPSATPRAVNTVYPYDAAGEAKPYSTDYHVLTNLNGISKLNIQVNLPETMQLLPVDAPEGQWMWYSNRADVADTRLTRAFDLTHASKASLNYKVWYSLEQGWDYGYVMVSADDGATWNILPASHTTDDNPHSNAYGPGYTGQSGGWLDETVSLDPYAGKQILVRFEVITDDATVMPGLALDDVRVPELRYYEGSEAGEGGWQAEGWVRTDNRLPGRAWVQAVEQVGSDVVVTRREAYGPVEIPLTLHANTGQVVVIISPLAPVTSVPVRYTLHVSGE
jgi:immune inhibitor A